MRNVFYIWLLIILSGSLAAQTNSGRNGIATKTVFEGQPASIRLAPRVTTTIRLPDPVNSVVLGDSNVFQAEYSPNEPLLVFARTTASVLARTNLVISTVRGRQFVLLLRSVGTPSNGNETSADLLVTCEAAQVRFIEETFPSTLVSETVNLDAAARPLPNESVPISRNENELPLDEFLNRQRNQKAQQLYGAGIRIAVGHIAQDGNRLIVPFSVINSKAHPIELAPPQVQLRSQSKAGIFRRTRWNTVQQMAIEFYRMTSRRLNRQQRADGVVIFERPPIKQSNEVLVLQIADSGAVDQPTLAPIKFWEIEPLEKNNE